ncbi:hypothetical protein, partial [Bacillus cereus]|uniref:hypothetical protein n=1 Tax=Bacillus cereus TaxID=1396 RepID=UPI0015CF5A4D
SSTGYQNALYAIGSNSNEKAAATLTNGHVNFTGSNSTMINANAYSDVRLDGGIYQSYGDNITGFFLSGKESSLTANN